MKHLPVVAEQEDAFAIKLSMEEEPCKPGKIILNGSKNSPWIRDISIFRRKNVFVESAAYYSLRAGHSLVTGRFSSPGR